MSACPLRLSPVCNPMRMKIFIEHCCATFQFDNTSLVLRRMCVYVCECIFVCLYVSKYVRKYVGMYVYSS